MEQAARLYDVPPKDAASIVGKRMLLPGAILTMIVLALFGITQRQFWLFLLLLPPCVFGVQFLSDKNNVVLCGSCLSYRRKSDVQRRSRQSRTGQSICAICHHYYSERSV